MARLICFKHIFGAV